MRLAKKLKLAAVFETSAKQSDSIQTTVDDVFFRCAVNCKDLIAEIKNKQMEEEKRGGSDQFIMRHQQSSKDSLTKQ